MKKKERKKKKSKKRIVIVKPDAIVKVEPHEVVLAERNLPATIHVDIQQLMVQAIIGKLPVDQMEKILAMRRELKEEWAKERFFTDLAAMQEEMPFVGRNKKVNADKLHYNYASIDQIVDVMKSYLKKYGFSYLSKTDQTKESLTAIVIAHHKDGHAEESRFTVPVPKAVYVSEPQAVGQAGTFAFRYAFRNVFGIITVDEDNDANQKKAPPAPLLSTQKTVPKQFIQKPKPDKTIIDGQITDHEKAVAYAQRIVVFATACMNLDLSMSKDDQESKVKEWLGSRTEKIFGKAYFRFRQMIDAQIIQLFESMRAEVESFEQPIEKGKTDGK